jgi:restriction system protein
MDPTGNTNVRLRRSATTPSPVRHPRPGARLHPNAVIASQSTEAAAHWLAEHGGDDVDVMTGTQFERCLAVMFTRLGYDVELTETYDFGADLIVTKDGLRSAVQAKRQAKRVGEHAVQQAIAGRDFYKCHAASVVTTAEVQPRVRTLAGSTGVSILDRQHLTRMLQMASMVEPPELRPAPSCARCRIALVWRSGQYGPFWGCVNYPRGCRMKEELRYTLVIAAAVGVPTALSGVDPTIQVPGSPVTRAASMLNLH